MGEDTYILRDFKDNQVAAMYESYLDPDSSKLQKKYFCLRIITLFDDINELNFLDARIV